MLIFCRYDTAFTMVHMSYVSPFFVVTMLTGDVLMLVTFLIMVGIPMYEMWILNLPFMMRESND